MFGTWHLPATKLLGPRFVAFENELIAAFGRFRPRLCVMEAPLHAYRQGSTNVARQQLGLAAYVDGEGHRARVQVREEQANTARKAVLGCGRFDSSEAAKAAAIAWCRAQGWMAGDDHQADALVLLRYSQMKGTDRLA